MAGVFKTRSVVPEFNVTLPSRLTACTAVSDSTVAFCARLLSDASVKVSPPGNTPAKAASAAALPILMSATWILTVLDSRLAGAICTLVPLGAMKLRLPPGAVASVAPCPICMRAALAGSAFGTNCRLLFDTASAGLEPEAP